jgi:pyruvate carboxylase
MKPSSIEVTVRVARGTGISYERHRVLLASIVYLHEIPGGQCAISVLGTQKTLLLCQESYDVVNALLGYRH